MIDADLWGNGLPAICARGSRDIGLGRRSRESRPQKPTVLGNVKNTIYSSESDGLAALDRARTSGGTPAAKAAADPDLPSPLFFDLVKATDGNGVSAE